MSAYICRFFALTILLFVTFFWFQIPEISARDNPAEIVAGVHKNFPPQYLIDKKTGRPDGFAIDVMNLVAKKAGLKVRYVVFDDWQAIHKALLEGRIDVVPNEGITKEREEFMVFSTPVETSKISLFVRSNTTDINGLNDLQERKVAVVSENKGLFIMQEYGKAELLICTSPEEGLLSLLSGSVDAFVYPEPTLLRIARKSGLEDHIKTAGEPLLEIKRAIGISKGRTELLNTLDKAVKAFVVSPEYKEIYSKWYGTPEPYWNVRHVLIAGGLVFALVIIIFTAWHYISLVRLNRELKASEQKSRTLFNAVNDAILIIDTTGRILDVNNITCERLGYPREKLLKMTPLDFDTPEYSARVQERIDEIRRKGSAIFETAWVTKDSRVIPTEINARTIEYDGKPAILSIARDITERKKAEDDLRKSEEFIKSILESVDEGFIVIDRDLRILSANRAFTEMSKMSLEHITGKHCYEISHHCDSPCYERGLMCAVTQVFETGKPHSVIHAHHNADGKPIYVETKAYPLSIGASGEVMTAIEVLVDITEHRKLEEQLRHAQKMEAVGTLAGGVAHDFNNILNVIMGYGSMLLGRLGDDDISREQINEVLAAADRASSLTKRLLAFSRKQVADVKPVNVNEIILGMEKMLSRIIGEDIVLAMELTDRKMIAMADAGQIEQVLMNLVSNARDAMPKGGKLTIRTGIREMDDAYIEAYGYGSPGTYSLISVADTGSGMDAETQGKIFEPFFTTKGIGEGTGLGLSIAYGIIKQHNGYINVYSEPGKGTEFKIYLPLIEEEAARGLEVEPAVAIKGGTETVLIAEDDASLRKLSSSVLASLGYSVITAEDGEDAIAKYKENRDKVRLVVLDLIMPKKNGKEVYDEIKNIWPDIRAIFVSGYSMDIISRKELIGEGMDFILKPVLPKDLLRKVREVLDK